MHTIDIGVIAIFTVLVLACGLSFSSSGKDMKSFFSAGAALPWWMSGLSLFMSFFSAGTFVVWGSIAYSHGWVAITIQWTMCIAGLFIGFYIAPKWQKTRVLTAAEFIKDRLGFKVQKVYTYIFLSIASFSTGAVLYPVAKIVEVSTGISIQHIIIGLGCLILLYTAVGGLWAVVVTDILQFVVLTAAVLVIVPLSLYEIGGIRNFVDKAPEGFFNLVNEEYSWYFIVAFGFYNLFLIAGNWAYIQRFTSVATAKDAKKVGWLFGGLYFISPVIWMIAPMIYRTLHPELTGFENESAYLLMAKAVLPIGMLGLMLAGMVFATSSSINTSLNIAAGVITNDIYRYFKPNASQKNLVRVGRISTACLGLVTIFVALLVPYMGGVVEVVMTMAALTGGALFLPPIWLLFSKYQTGVSILTTTFITLTINCLFKFVTPSMFDVSLNRAQEMMLGVGLPIILLAVFELLLRARKHPAPFYTNYLATVASRTELANSAPHSQQQNDNQKGLNVISFGVTSTGMIMLVIALIADKGQAVVATTGALVLVLGIGIFLLSHPKNSAFGALKINTKK